VVPASPRPVRPPPPPRLPAGAAADHCPAQLRPDQEQHDHGVHRHRERRVHQTRDAAVADLQRTPQLLLGGRAEDDTDDGGQHRQAAAPHPEPDQTDDQQHQVDHLAAHRVRADRREEQEPA